MSYHDFPDHVIAARKEDLEIVKKQDSELGYSSSDILSTFVSHLCEVDTPMITVGKSETVRECFQKLLENKILSIPVWGVGRYTSFIDIVDILCYTLDVIGEDILTGYDTISSNNAFNVPAGPIADNSTRNPFVSVENNCTLRVAIETIVRRKIYRLAVVNSQGELMNILTQSFIVRWLSKKEANFPISDSTIQELELGTSPVLSVNIKDTAASAFKKILENNISGVAVVDDTGKLVSNLSISDLKALGYDTYMLCNLYLPLEGFLKLGKFGVHSPITISKSATFKELLEAFTINHIHRIFVVNEDGTPASVISLSDVLTAIANKC